MKTLLTLLLLAASAFGQTATISDTIRTPFGGTFSGTVTVSLNSPALAQPLYSGSVTLSGWTQAVTVTAGVFTLTLYTNDLITPGGTSYTATYAPTSGSGWKETWIVPTGATTIREIRSTTVPSPSVRFTPSQITQAGATLGQGLKWDGSKWAPADVVANPMTTNGDLITRLGGVPVRVGIGSTNQVLTVSGGMPVWASGITGNASTATALAANGTNCSAGSFPLGVDASGNAESCTAAVTASTGLSDSADIVRGGAALTTPGSVPFVTAAGVLGQSANFRWDNANNRFGVGTSSPGFLTHFVGISGTDSGWSRTTWQDATNVTRSNWINGAGFATIGTITADPFVFVASNTESFRIAATTRNLLLGTTTDDGTNRLQVAGSGAFTNAANNVRMIGSSGQTPGLIFTQTGVGAYTIRSRASVSSLEFLNDSGVRLAEFGQNGTFTLYNETPTTGSTSLVVRAGAGQTGNLQTWQNSAGTGIANVDSIGRINSQVGFLINTSGGAVLSPFAGTLGSFARGFAIGWGDASDGAVHASGYLFRGTTGTTTDLSLSRASANTLQVGDGGANALGTVNALALNVGGTATNSNTIVISRTGGNPSTLGLSALFDKPLISFSGSAGLTFENISAVSLMNLSSTGTLSVHNQAPTVGSTSVVVRAGAGQGTNLLQQWQNSSGSSRLQVTSTLGMQALGTFFAVQDSAGTINRAILQSTLDINNTYSVRWSSTGDAGGTPDLSLSRASANTLQVGDGAANSNGTILARIHTWANGTEGTCDATLRGQVVMVQGGAGVADTFRVCRKDAANAYAWTALY